jgi:hypothetical protein
MIQRNRYFLFFYFGDTFSIRNSRGIVVRVLFLLCIQAIFPLVIFSQSLPVGMRVFEEYYRRKQLLSAVDSNISFTLRPLSSFFVDAGLSEDTDSNLRFGSKLYQSANRRKIVQILPLSWQQQYHSHPYYAWNNGSMIPAKGYQSMLSAGLFAKYGPFSIQLNPDFVFATNDEFNEVSTHYGPADLPVRFGNNSYSRFSWGQSSIRLNFDPVSIGISNENLWWGPGIQNSILMSNTAPGFKHLTLNTTKPVKTPIGSIEAQILAGRLEGSGYTPALTNEWRYLSGMVFSYQPRWFNGLFLGMTRSFQINNENMGNGFDDYFPLFSAFQKKKTSEDDKKRDQVTSVFLRWLLKETKAEVYFEYGLNDHSYNIRDFLMTPEHSRAYTIGFNKLIPYKGRDQEYVQVGVELSHLEQSIDRAFRNSGEWYTHNDVPHGYTHRGEVLGAGIGPGGNFAALNVAWVKSLNRLGFQLERYEHNGDLGARQSYGEWVDFAFSAVADRVYNDLIISTKLQGIQSQNYQWNDGLNGRPKHDKFQINAEVGIIYRFKK